jgi:signal transduction histidine kinase
MGLARLGRDLIMADQVPLTPEILIPLLGDVLVDKGLITREQKEITLIRQAELREQGRFLPFGHVLIELGFIDRGALDGAVTEQILALRAALQDANHNLERRVELRTLELQEALEKLAELNQLKTNFVSNISHELRTPLTHIKGYLDLLITHDLGIITPEQERALLVMQRSSERLERLIEDLILFSTAERGEITLHIMAFDLSSLCKSIIQRILPKAAEKKIEIGFETDCDPIIVEADQDKIDWVLMQLLDNAIKFTPPRKRVVLKLDLEEKYVLISVSDTGIGIPEDRIDEIFEPFHQLDSSSTRRYGGTGLGLALVQKIIMGHGSVIQVSSQVNQGSTFEFMLKRGHLGS